MALITNTGLAKLGYNITVVTHEQTMEIFSELTLTLKCNFDVGFVGFARAEVIIHIDKDEGAT